MDDSRTLSDWLLVAASRELKGKAHRVFVAKVCQSLCGGSSPQPGNDAIKQTATTI